MDDAGTEHPDGWVLIAGDRVEAVGAGSPPDADEMLDLGGALVTPGFINVHHHLCQTLTRTRAQNADLLDWFRTLLPLWARNLDAEAEYAAARTGIAELALSGCTTVFDHQYFYPDSVEGVVEAEIKAAQEIGSRIVVSRGSLDMGESKGGLIEDKYAEDPDYILAETERLVMTVHEAGPGAKVQIVPGPCTLFTSSKEVFRDSAQLARAHGLRLHTHLAEATDEEPYSLDKWGCRALDFFADVGWLESDVWCAHSIHLNDEDIRRMGEAGTGVAHCPASNLRVAAGICKVKPLLSAGVPVGLGVDGSASNERSDMTFEMRLALLVARGRDGATALSARDVLHMATRNGAAVLGRDDLGSLEPGKCADLAVWRTDGLEFGGANDPVAALVFAGPFRADRVYVGGGLVVEDGNLAKVDESEIARAHRVQAARFL
jgi:cytosine/adenosine deaminase-related metal-dependent hydrolase